MCCGQKLCFIIAGMFIAGICSGQKVIFSMSKMRTVQIILLKLSVDDDDEDEEEEEEEEEEENR
jgi:hypothetical protein